jgi:hypothetical protein
VTVNVGSCVSYVRDRDIQIFAESVYSKIGVMKAPQILFDFIMLRNTKETAVI